MDLQPLNMSQSGSQYVITAPELTDEEFHAFRKLVYDRFGINLTEQKRSLIIGRLQRLLREQNFSTFSQYIDYLHADPTGQSLIELVNRISTNHTFFFREKEHFDFLIGKALPDILSKLKATNNRDLRIWCAGCSSGEEAYTITMLMMELLGMEYGSWNAGLLATDVSEKVLTLAKAGIYTEDRISLVPENLKHKYFHSTTGGQYIVADRLKQEITYRRFNLMNEVFPFKKQFHVIFCRNVMIYFDQPTRDALVKRFYDCTAPGGYFFIGHSETIRHGESGYRYIMPSVYQKGIN